ncbi:MAG: GDP-mannose 4,6-dehydratase [Dehalococcoidia bacterium]|nr:MAG: GDP-mannose 4,6-dehydratase [Dehalococcoidia bacterium]
MREAQRVALITGITGQDGSYLAELLLAKGYDVHGLIRRSSVFNTERIEHLLKDSHDPESRLHLHYGDLLDSSSLRRLMEDIRPTEVYNLAAQTHVRVSFDMPEYTAHTITVGTTSLLEAIHQSGVRPRFYQAGSSEMYGDVLESTQNEDTPFRPQSPYAAAKVGAHMMVRVYREAYDLFAVNGTLFNHESPRRSPSFVTRKITRGAARILAELDDSIYLGNLNAQRDWGYAPEYMGAIWAMLQQDTPEDFVIATGETHSVREFLEETFRLARLDVASHVRFDSVYLRPAEVNLLRGDASRAKARLGWEPQTRFKQLVRLMLEADCREVGLDPNSVLLPA